eukprot:NODE_5462_length_508_cov_23.455338_g4069_i0.p1 GENE.NODE_5462_length_508_cov_23.455338_g4069_i0~~NODE_5462_length_508_cov_23.455338_g4069_i0.p1  ORF type:complete len:161 (-),score=22.17 NODE_5462_length_508_cov_23.455338_g4069_i0:24-437(-)
MWHKWINGSATGKNEKLFFFDHFFFYSCVPQNFLEENQKIFLNGKRLKKGGGYRDIIRRNKDHLKCHLLFKPPSQPSTSIALTLQPSAPTFITPSLLLHLLIRSDQWYFLTEALYQFEHVHFFGEIWLRKLDFRNVG